jgi:hypothetical protein
LTPNAHKDKPESCAKIGIILETSKCFRKKNDFANKRFDYICNFFVLNEYDLLLKISYILSTHPVENWDTGIWDGVFWGANCGILG